MLKRVPAAEKGYTKAQTNITPEFQPEVTVSADGFSYVIRKAYASYNDAASIVTGG